MVFKLLENAVDKMSLDNFVYGPRQNSSPGSYHPIIFTGKKNYSFPQADLIFFLENLFRKGEERTICKVY